MPAALPSPSLRALVAGVVDYAGLFPPAGLSMAEATAHYAGYLASEDAWMLGRFVVPVQRLDELGAMAAPRLRPGAAPWRLSALVGDDLSGDAGRILAFNVAHGGRLVADVAELKAASVERVTLAMDALGAHVTVYCELPPEPDPRPLLEAVAGAGARAKIRTGGVTPDAFPTTAQVARFIARCAELDVPFKATAGLHHPLRGEHPLTYEPDAPAATMFGFLNVFAAGVLATAGVGEEELRDVLEEKNAGAFAFGADELTWRGHRVGVEQLERARDTFAVAFGSCSFREPVDDLQELALP